MIREIGETPDFTEIELKERKHQPYMTRQEIIKQLRKMGGCNQENLDILSELNCCTVSRLYRIVSKQEMMILCPPK